MPGVPVPHASFSAHFPKAGLGSGDIVRYLAFRSPIFPFRSITINSASSSVDVREPYEYRHTNEPRDHNDCQGSGDSQRSFASFAWRSSGRDLLDRAEHLGVVFGCFINGKHGNSGDW
jgi:hypothetical protein